MTEKQENKPIVGLNREKTGRAKGTPNKTTKLLKEAILIAADEAGKKLDPDGGLVTYLVQQAVLNPAPFMTLLGKVLPMQVAGIDDGEGFPTDIVINIVRPKS